MSKHIVTINHDGEENVEYFLDDTSIASVSHDQHGWEGMALAAQLVENFAEALNITIIETHN